MYYNKVIIAGGLTADPKEINCESGGCYFSLAVKDGDNTNFVPCVAFGKLSKTCLKYLEKGKNILVDGAFTSRKKGDKTYYSVFVNTMKFIGAPKKDTENTTKKNDEPDEDFPF